MTRVRCPQERCIFWLDGWCDSDEIELDPSTLSCITFEEVDDGQSELVVADDDDELEWEDDESIFEEELDESLYGYDDGEDDEDEEEELVADDEESWPL